MLAREFGHVVNISSIWGKCGMSLRSTYSPSKHALGALTHCLHYEFHDKKNLHFTVICPGPVVTDADKNALMGEGQSFRQPDPLIRTGMTAKRGMPLRPLLTP
jgi:short-subunit dehydrogenase